MILSLLAAAVGAAAASATSDRTRASLMQHPYSATDEPTTPVVHKRPPGFFNLSFLARPVIRDGPLRRNLRLGLAGQPRRLVEPGQLRGAAVTWVTKQIFGMEPQSDATQLPVFIFLPTGGGTAADFGPDSSEVSLWYPVEMAADRGFLAATIESVGEDMDCQALAQNAFDLFQYPSATSALSVLCSHPRANCSLGVVVSGYGLGGMHAMMAPQFTNTVRATMAWASGNIVPGWDKLCGAFDTSFCTWAPGSVVGGEELPCLTNAELNRSLPNEHRRFVIGQQDENLGGWNFNHSTTNESYGALRQLKSMSGFDCGEENTCSPDGGGGYAYPIEIGHRSFSRFILNDGSTMDRLTGYDWGVAGALNWACGLVGWQQQ
jgi:hypothetical protein